MKMKNVVNKTFIFYILNFTCSVKCTALLVDVKEIKIYMRFQFYNYQLVQKKLLLFRRYSYRRPRPPVACRVTGTRQLAWTTLTPNAHFFSMCAIFCLIFFFNFNRIQLTRNSAHFFLWPRSVRSVKWIPQPMDACNPRSTASILPTLSLRRNTSNRNTTSLASSIFFKT